MTSAKLRMHAANIFKMSRNIKMANVIDQSIDTLSTSGTCPSFFGSSCREVEQPFPSYGPPSPGQRPESCGLDSRNEFQTRKTATYIFA